MLQIEMEKLVYEQGRLIHRDVMYTTVCIQSSGSSYVALLIHLYFDRDTLRKEGQSSLLYEALQSKWLFRDTKIKDLILVDVRVVKGMDCVQL